MTRIRTQKNKGFVALLAAIIIAAIWAGIAFSLSEESFSSRWNTLNGEFKERSRALAESCISSALLKISQDYSYAPAASGDVEHIGSETCTIESVAYGAEDPSTHRKTATIRAAAEVGHAWSGTEVEALVKNPSLPSPAAVFSEQNITIVSWQEK
jgi:hypothetical protein